MHNGVGNCSSKTGSRRQSEKKTILKHFLKGFLEGKSLAPKWRKSKSLWRPSCSHSNTIYEVQLQKTIVLRMQPQHEATLTQPLQCELQNTIELRATASEITCRSSRFGDGLCMEKHRVSCICYLSKTHFVRDFLQNSIGNSSTSTTCNPIYSEGTILELQITMGIPSATHPPAPLAIPFTLRERSYSCKSQWNSVDRTCTKNTWNPIYNAEPIRPWSENIRPWSDHTRDRLAPVAPQR